MCGTEKTTQMVNLQPYGVTNPGATFELPTQVMLNFPIVLDVTTLFAWLEPKGKQGPCIFPAFILPNRGGMQHGQIELSVVFEIHSYVCLHSLLQQLLIILDLLGPCLACQGRHPERHSFKRLEYVQGFKKFLK